MIADIFEAVSVDATLAPYEQYLGAEFIAVNTAHPRMIWVPTHEKTRLGRREKVAPGDASQPRSVLTRIAGVKVRCWAKAQGLGNVADTIAEVRALEEEIRLLIAAVHRAAYGVFTVESIMWLDQDGASLTQYGRAADVNFSFEIPVYETNDEAGLAAVTIEGLTQSGIIYDNVETQTQTLVMVTVTTDEAEVSVGEASSFVATATYSDGSTAQVTALAMWASATPAVATVDQGGTVTGIEIGSASISATLAGVSGALPVTVV